MYAQRDLPPSPAPMSQAGGPGLTAAEARAAVEGWTDLSAVQRRDRISALSIVGKWLGRPAGDFPLSPEFLRLNLLTKSAAAFGVGTDRWSNLKADLGKVMLRLG